MTNATATVIDASIAKRVLEIVDAGLVKGVGVPEPGKMCVEAAVCYAMGLPHGDDPACVSRALRSLKIRLNDARWSSSEARSKGLRRLALIQLGSAGELDDRAFVQKVAAIAIRKQVPVALRAAASILKDAKHKAALLDAAIRCEKDGDRAAAQAARKTADAAAAAAAAYAADAAYAAAAAAYAAYAATAAAYAAYAAAAAAADAADAAAADAAAAAAADAAAADAAAADAAAAYAYAAADARDKVLSDFAEDVVQVLIEMRVPGVQWLPLTEAAA